MALSANLCGLFRKRRPRINDFRVGIVDEVFSITNGRIAVLRYVLVCRAMTCFTADSKFSHSRVRVSRVGDNPWLPMCCMASDASIIPRSNCFGLLSNLRRHHEHVITPNPTLVFKEIDIWKIVQHAAFPTIDPVHLIVMGPCPSERLVRHPGSTEISRIRHRAFRVEIPFRNTPAKRRQSRQALKRGLRLGSWSGGRNDANSRTHLDGRRGTPAT